MISKFLGGTLSFSLEPAQGPECFEACAVLNHLEQTLKIEPLGNFEKLSLLKPIVEGHL